MLVPLCECDERVFFFLCPPFQFPKFPSFFFFTGTDLGRDLLSCIASRNARLQVALVFAMHSLCNRIPCLRQEKLVGGTWYTEVSGSCFLCPVDTDSQIAKFRLTESQSCVASVWMQACEDARMLQDGAERCGCWNIIASVREKVCVRGWGFRRVKRQTAV